MGGATPEGTGSQEGPGWSGGGHGRGQTRGNGVTGGAGLEWRGSREGSGRRGREESFRLPGTAALRVPVPARTGIEKERHPTPSAHCSPAHSSQTRKQPKCLWTEEWIEMWPVRQRNVTQLLKQTEQCCLQQRGRT